MNCNVMDNLDLNIMDRKSPSLQDHINMVKVLDYLDEVHLILGPYTQIEGVPAICIHPQRTNIGFKHTSKPYILAGIFGNETWTIKMTQAVGRNAIGLSETAPPLTWAENKTDCIFHWLETGFPIALGTGLAMGMTSPVTLAGALVQQLAETFRRDDSYPHRGKSRVFECGCSRRYSPL